MKGACLLPPYWFSRVLPKKYQIRNKTPRNIEQSGVNDLLLRGETKESSGSFSGQKEKNEKKQKKKCSKLLGLIVSPADSLSGRRFCFQKQAKLAFNMMGLR